MSGLFDDPAGFVLGLLFKIPALLLAVTVHELAHGLVADRLGDPTARLQGRLTLNPIPHIDPLGALAFVIAGFGWAKPVPVNAYNLRHPIRDMALIAAAGPVSNFALAFVGILAFRLVQPTSILPAVIDPLLAVLSYVFLYNLGLGVFNLIPLPPLDGGHFLPYFLPRASWAALHKVEQYGPIILIVAVMSGATRYVVGPALRFLVGVFDSVARFVV